MESFLAKKQWRCTFDPTFEFGRRRKEGDALVFADGEADTPESNEDQVALGNLLHDECFSEDLRELLRLKYE